jgi:proteasome accessory factor A
MGIPKYLGRDCELSTTGIDPDGRRIDPWDVTQAVLARIPEVFAPRPTWTRRSTWSSSGYGGHSTDELRQWTPNGQCYYSDLAHVECCTAETKDPLSFAAQSLSLLLVAEEARARAEAEAPAGTRYLLSAAGVDLRDPGISWGAHLNVALSSELWEDLFVDHQSPSRLGFVSSALGAAIVFFGGGYLLPEREGIHFCLSARAHHLLRLSTLATTTPFERGILNSRREAHASGEERLHLIGFDFTLAGAALLASFVQCVLLAAEEGTTRLALARPVEAVHHWSTGLDPVSGRVSCTEALADGGRVTLAAYVGRLVALLQEMCAGGLIREEDAPRAALHLEQIRELAQLLEQGDLAGCARHLDWAAKLLHLRSVCRRQGLALDSAPLRLLDHDYASTDPARGAFWRLWAAGEIDPLVTPEAVEQALVDGPEDSRAWTRGRLVQRFAAAISDLDWSRVELVRGGSRWEPRFRLELEQPGAFARARAEGWLAAAEDVDQLVRELERHSLPEGQRYDPALAVRERIVRLDA